MANLGTISVLDTIVAAFALVSVVDVDAVVVVVVVSVSVGVDNFRDCKSWGSTLR